MAVDLAAVDQVRPVSTEPRPGARLAAAVLARALDDLRDPRPHVRAQACGFFASAWLAFWCGYLDLDTADVRARVLRPVTRDEP